MSHLSKKELTLFAVLGAVTTIIGLILFVVFRGDYMQQEFWSIYKVAASGTGLMMLIFGMLWMLLGLLNLKTRIFDSNAKMDADKLVIIVIAVGIAVALTLVLTIPRLPHTPTNKLPADPKRRATIGKVGRGFRGAVSGIVIACGVVMLSGPWMRFIKK